jgi:polyhydroxyalkanoate synthesis regulator phasin
MPAPKSSSSRPSSSSGTAKRPATGAKATTAAARSGAKGTATSARKAASRTATQAKAGTTRTRKAAASGAAKTSQAASRGGARGAAKAAGSAVASTAKAARGGTKGTATAARSGAKQTATRAKAGATRTRRASGGSDGLAPVAEQLMSRVIKPRDLVILTRDRIQDTLDEAAQRGRVTRKDADELVAELVRRGRSQSDELLSEIEQLLDRGREQLGSVTKRARKTEAVDRLVRGADRARRAVGVGPSFPILGYDDLNVSQVQERLGALSRPELGKVRTYESKHANRKSVLGALDKSLGSRS